MGNYVVKQGESIGDVVLNSTGSFSNLDAILEANGFDTWTPVLIPGQIVIIPENLPVDLNTRRQLAIYPACNASISDVYSKISTVFNTIFDNWILATWFWRDQAVWIDTKNWND